VEKRSSSSRATSAFLKRKYETITIQAKFALKKYIFTKLVQI
jgi:hypothetical protein